MERTLENENEWSVRKRFSAPADVLTRTERVGNTSWRNDEESRNFLRGRGSGRSIAGEKSNGKIDI